MIETHVVNIYVLFADSSWIFFLRGLSLFVKIPVSDVNNGRATLRTRNPTIVFNPKRISTETTVFLSADINSLHDEYSTKFVHSSRNVLWTTV